MSILRSKHSGWTWEGRRTPFGGGSGGGGGPTQSTTVTSNIPEYARPYVETMLGAAQKQAYQYDSSGNIVGFQPYVPYGATVGGYTETGAPIITNTAQEQAAAAVAGFSPMQEQAFRQTARMQVPGQFALGTGLQALGGTGALQAAQGAAPLMGEALGYGATGAQYGGIGAQEALARAQQTARQAGQFGRLGAGFGARAAGLAPTAQEYGATAADVGMGGLGYGAMGAGYGAQAAGLSPTAQLFGQEAADIGAAGGAGAQALAQQVARQATGYGGQLARSGRLGLQAGEEMGAIGGQGLGLGALGTGYGARGVQAAEQGFGAGEQYARMATSPEAMGAYMSPYMQQAVDRQKFEATRDYAKQLAGQKAAAVGAGAFGGSRQAIVEAEAQRNLNQQLQNIQAAGTQRAFEQAQQAQQYGAGLGLQGLQAGYQGLGMGMQGVGQGLAGLGTALQGQQGRLAGLGAYQQGLQGAQAGLGQALGAGQLGLGGTQQALAGQQARMAALTQAGQFLGQGMQGAQIGMAGISPALQGLQGAQAGLGQAGQLYGLGMQGAGVGLQGVGAQQAAAQLGLAGTAQGMQGAGLGLQGVGQAVGAGQYGLSGLGAATQAGSALGQMGTQQLAAQQGIIGLQSQAGAQQQQLEQARINQAIQNYALQQQYPQLQLSTMSSLLRGLPLQQATTQQYQAAPSAISQIGGLGAAGVGLYGLGRGAGIFKEGGHVKKLAKGGITGLSKRVLMNPEDFSTQQIDSMTKKGMISQLVGLPVLDAKMKDEQRMKMSQAAQQPTPAETIAAEIMARAAAAQGIDNAESNLPVMSAFDGGIVAMAQGGEIDDDGVVRLYGGGSGTMAGFEDVPTTGGTEMEEYTIDPMTGERLYSGYGSKKPATTAAAPAPKKDTGIKILPDAPRPQTGATPPVPPAVAESDSALSGKGIADILKRYEETLGKGEARDKEAKKEAFWSSLAEFGFGAMAGSSPFAATNIGQAGVPAVKSGVAALRDIRAREEKRGLARAQLGLEGEKIGADFAKLRMQEPYFKAYAQYLARRPGSTSTAGLGSVSPAVADKVMTRFQGYEADPKSAPFFGQLPKEVQQGLTKYKPGTESYSRSMQLFRQYNDRAMQQYLNSLRGMSAKTAVTADED